MTGPFRNPRIATLFGVFLVHAVIQQIDGYPRGFQEYLMRIMAVEHPSMDNHVGTRQRFKEWQTSSENNYRYIRRYRDPFYDETRDMGDREDDERVDMSDRIGRVDDDVPGDAKTTETTPVTKDTITRAIKEALDKRILLSPREWDETLAQNQFKSPADDPAKVQKVRSPRGPAGEPPQTTESNRSDTIFFPGSKMPGQALDARTVSVPICEGARFCTHKTNYPSDSEIKETLNQNYLPPVADPPSIAKRFGATDEDMLCRSERTPIKPTSGLDNTNTWRIIFNNNEYVQTVNVEICSNLNQPCEYLDVGYRGYPTKCVQKYIYRHLVGLGPNGTEIIPFEMPSSCCCQLVIPSA